LLALSGAVIQVISLLLYLGGADNPGFILGLALEFVGVLVGVLVLLGPKRDGRRGRR